MPDNNQTVTTLAITGTIGSGKSTVGAILEELGIPVIDADKIVHELLACDQDTQKEIIARFGAEVVLPSGATVGQINRKALGKIVFHDTKAKKDLETIVHPRVRQATLKKISEYGANPTIKIVAILAPLLFEANLGGEYDQTWAVIACEETLKARLRHRDGFSDSELRERIASQWSQEKKAARADKVIDNSLDLANTKSQVLALLNELKGAVGV